LRGASLLAAKSKGGKGADGGSQVGQHVPADNTRRGEASLATCCSQAVPRVISSVNIHAISMCYS